MKSYHFRRLDAVSYLAAILLSALFAFLLRFDFALTPHVSRMMLVGIVLAAAVKLPVFYFTGIHRDLKRYADISDLCRLFYINLAASSAYLAVALIFRNIFPVSICGIDFLACCVATLLIRYSPRMFSERKSWPRDLQQRKGILIYGAGSAGATLLREIRENRALGYEAAGFLDDDPAKQGSLIGGTEVLGCGRQAASIVSRLNRTRNAVEEIVIAMPSISGRERREALANCQLASVPCKTIPGLGDLLVRSILAEQIRDVSVTDLLGRPPVQLEEEPIREHLAGRCILITGAAGSIGSELCRQVARFRPSLLIGLDQAESELFKIECELRARYSDLEFIPALGDIRDRNRIAEIFDRWKIDTVFHAAAYKHVPMMEFHVSEAVHNNILGTWNLVNAVHEHGVPNFLMISSDKAVNPTSVMGATKRVCEQIVSAAQGARSGANTKCVSVRFGNVLGSNGSVVPIFQAQIAAGGPVRVTHPDIQRYFMTASEAVSLVLQASTIGTGSELFVLDMGEPIRIADLAENMIRLAGLVPHQDIEIRFTGLRPGEKLFEETNTPEERVLPTYHEKIKIFAHQPPEWTSITEWIARVRPLLAKRRNYALIEHIQELVPEYTPGETWSRKTAAHAGSQDHNAQLTA